MTTTTEVRHVCPPDHRHNLTGTCYNQHRCRCASCTKAIADTARNRHRAKVYGRYVPPDFVDAEPVREHIARLQEFGLGVNRIGSLAGVAMIQRVMYGDPSPRADEPRVLPARMAREKAQRILSVRADLSLIADGATVSNRGARRRLQALMAQGWSTQRLGEHLGIQRQEVLRFVRIEKIRGRTHRAIADLFDLLWDKTPPHTEPRDRIAYDRIRRHASAHGWQSPLAWDDIDLDDAPSRLAEYQEDDVDDAAVAIAITGEPIDLTPAEREAAVVALHAQRFSDVEIAERLHCTSRTVLRIRHERLNLPAVAGNNVAA